MAGKNTKKIIARIGFVVLLALVVFLLVFFLKDVFFPLLKLQSKKDNQGAKQLLQSKGFLGWATVSMVEALQMVVIFVPAEFIQITSGMSYPWYIALILCDIGVMIGCSLIYCIVNVFKFDDKTLGENSKIEKFRKRATTNNSILFMYILFIMPVIPFGAICYWGSNKKIPYHKYLLTCATGVIPSIITSNLMGTAVKQFIAHSLPLWLLILIIIALAGLLFVLLAFVLKKFFFKNTSGTPYSVFYSIIFAISKMLLAFRGKINVIGNEEVTKLKGPYLIIANHHSANDFYYISKLDTSINYSFVMNRYYFGLPVLGKVAKSAGFIPKKIFDSDFSTIKGIVKAKKQGFPIVLFPEGRLSTDGTTSAINTATAGLVKSLKIPLVLVRIQKGYFVKPKWRKKELKCNVDVQVKKVLSEQDISAMSQEEIYGEIINALSFNEFECKDIRVKANRRAEGLERVLYYCPFCKRYYTNKTHKSTLTCSSCGKSFYINEDYSFDSDEVKNIGEYYRLIKEKERAELDILNMSLPVKTKIYDPHGKTRWDSGVFTISSEKVSYKSDKTECYFEYTVKQLEGIAYSVGVEFEMYYNNELYYFYPERGELCARVALIYELIRERV